MSSANGGLNWEILLYTSICFLSFQAECPKKMPSFNLKYTGCEAMPFLYNLKYVTLLKPVHHTIEKRISVQLQLCSCLNMFNLFILFVHVFNWINELIFVYKFISNISAGIKHSVLWALWIFIEDLMQHKNNLASFIFALKLLFMQSLTRAMKSPVGGVPMYGIGETHMNLSEQNAHNEHAYTCCNLFLLVTVVNLFISVNRFCTPAHTKPTK